MDRLFSSTTRLEGGALVTSWVRAVKTAYIIPTGGVDEALRSIQSCCLSWGGSQQILVPYADSLTDDWLQILQNYDPDFIVDYATISSKEVSNFADNGHYVYNAKSRQGEHLFVPGALIHTAAAANLESLQPEGIRIVIPVVPADHPLSLQLLAHYGSLVDESSSQQTFVEHGLLPSVRLNQIFRVVLADFSNQDVGSLLEPPLGRVPADIQRTLLLPEVTLFNHAHRGPSRPLLDPKSPEYESENRKHADLILVTGRTDSIHDLCLFWTIRANRSWLRKPFPIWLPLDELKKPSGRALVKKALGLAARPPAFSMARDILYVLSSSSDEQEITAALQGEIPSEIVTERFSEFIPDNFERGEREELDISFERGGAHLPHPANEKLSRFGDLDRVTREIRIAGFQLPQTPSLRLSVMGKAWRITRRGFAHTYYPRHRDQLDSLFLPATWDALEAVCKDAGYTVRISDKGQLAEGVLELLGGLNRVALLTSSLVYRQLARLAEMKGRQHFRVQLREMAPNLSSSDVDDLVVAASAQSADEVRDAQVFSEFVTSFGDRELTRRILDWLLDRRILFRGADLTCPECGFRRWYGIDNFGTDYRCEGCQRTSKSPLNASATNWRYRLNELYARAFDQGVLIHLIVAYQREYASITSEFHLGYHPGVELISEAGDVELDYVSIREGRLSIGECKVSIDRFDEAEAEKLTKLAKSLDCSEIVIGTLSSKVPESVVANLESVVEQVDIWTHDDLIDSRPRSSEGPEEPTAYLNRIADQMKYWSA